MIDKRLSCRVPKENLTKTATEFKDIKDAVFHLWHPERGPFENLFGMLRFLVPFIPVCGWTLFFLEQIGSWIGMGLPDLGKYFDNQLGVHAGSNISQEHIDKGGRLLEKMIGSKVAAYNQNGFVKQAFFGNLFKRLIPRGMRLVFKVLLAVLAAVGVDQVRDLNTRVQQQGGWAQVGVKKVTEEAQKMMGGGDSETTEDTTENNTEISENEG